MKLFFNGSDGGGSSSHKKAHHRARSLVCFLLLLLCTERATKSKRERDKFFMKFNHRFLFSLSLFVPPVVCVCRST
jgi:hypothetical protein